MHWKAASGTTQKLRWLERAFLIAGAILLCVFASMRLYNVVASRSAIAGFQRSSAASASTADAGNSAVPGGDAVHTELWSDKRIAAYQASLSHAFGTPLAVLEIPKLRLEVPVFDGTDDVTLDRGVGRIVGTAHPGHSGNIGIAGHRDGFFRGLKDIATGDEIKLVLPDAVSTYVVDQITVTSPQDVSVLKPRPAPSITLVTCFPFYFVGSAPERYIVSASLRADAQTAARENVRPNK
jgi:sortase A